MQGLVPFQGNLLANSAGKLMGALGQDGDEYLFAVTLNTPPLVTNLTLYTPGSVTVTGGTINGTTIGQTTPAAVKTSNLAATFTDSSATPGSVTNNSPRGKASMVANVLTPITITNSLVTATSSIFIIQESTDNNVYGLYVVPAAGSFTVNFGMGTVTAPTSSIKFSFLVVN